MFTLRVPTTMLYCSSSIPPLRYIEHFLWLMILSIREVLVVSALCEAYGRLLTQMWTRTYKWAFKLEFFLTNYYFFKITILFLKLVHILIYLLRNKNQTLAKTMIGGACFFLGFLRKLNSQRKKIFQKDTFKTLLTVITILYFQSKNQGRKLHFLKKYKIFVFFKGRLMKTVLNRSCRIHDHKAATLVIVVGRHWGYRVSLYSTKNWITKSFPSNWLGIYPGPKKGTCRN